MTTDALTSETAQSVEEAGQTWTKTISPHRGIFQIDWKSVWAYRDLVAMFVRRDFVASYKQTILGPFWFVVQPLATTLVFTVVFGRFTTLSTDKVPPFLFYMSGVVPWSYFADCVLKTSMTFTANAGIFGKVYFPRLVMPTATIISNVLTFGLQLFLFFCFYTYLSIKGAPLHLGLKVLILPLLVAQMAALGVGIGCLVSALTTRYRDLALGLSFGVQLWMYASCVFYPITQLSPQWRSILIWNPMVPIIETFRAAVLGVPGLAPSEVALGIGLTLIIFFAGLFSFNAMEKSFTDTV